MISKKIAREALSTIAVLTTATALGIATSNRPLLARNQPLILPLPLQTPSSSKRPPLVMPRHPKPRPRKISLMRRTH